MEAVTMQCLGRESVTVQRMNRPRESVREGNPTLVDRRAGGPSSSHVLLADGDPALLRVFSAILSTWGIRVTTASTGLECLRRLRETVPDLLLLELRLLWGGGEGILAVMREQRDLAAVPVVVLTTDADPLTRVREQRFPVCDYLVKPVRMAALIASMQSVVGAARRGCYPAHAMPVPEAALFSK